MGLFGKNKKSNVPFAISKHGLEEFWNSLTPEEQRKSIVSAECGLTSGGGMNLLTNNLGGDNINPTGILGGVGKNLMNSKEYELSDKFLTEAIRLNSNVIDVHFALNSIIELTYKHRENKKMMERCIHYCKQDIDMMDSIASAFNSEYPNVKLPRIPSFQRLTIIYENQGNILNAIQTCETALSYGLEDGTKGGFEGRLEKLKKKL